MDTLIALLVLILINGICAFLGYVAGCFKRADYLSEQLKVAQWQRDQAIRQRDELRQGISTVSEEVNKLWAHDVWDARSRAK